MGKTIWLIKSYLFQAFLWLVSKKNQFIAWITRYYPFSLMFQKNWCHANLQPVRQLRDKLERVSKLAHKPIIITDGKAYEDEMEFSGLFNYRVTNKPASMRSLEKVLQAKFGSIYVRDHQKGFRILFPYNLCFKD